MGRPRSEINESELIQYYQSGFNDCQIAEKMGISRMTAARRRAELKLACRSQRGWRGMSIHGDEPYWRFVRRVFERYPELARQFRSKAAGLYQRQKIDYPSYFICLGTEPMAVRERGGSGFKAGRKGFEPGELEQIIAYEKSVELSGMVGVPGKELIDLVRVMRTASSAVIEALIEQSVLHAGLVNINACLGHPFICYPFSSCQEFWEGISEDSQRWLEALLAARKAVRCQ